MKRIAFLFTGQGTQFTGMAKTFYDKYAIARQTFDEAGDVLGFDMAKLCFEGSLTELSKTENTQPAILTASTAIYRVYMEEIGIAPEFCVGHSLGEYAALTCSGAIKFSEALKLVYKRGMLCSEIAESGIGAMTIVEGLKCDEVEEACRKASNEKQIAAINVYNSPLQFSIAGHREAVEEAETYLLEKGANVTPMMFSAPFHSPLMEVAARSIRNELMKCRFSRFMWPVISNVTALPYRNKEEIADLLVQQIMKPVQWQSTMEFLVKNGITVVIEMGPKNVLSSLAMANTDAVDAFCYGQAEHRDRLYSFLNADKSMKKTRPTVVTMCMAAAAATPNNNFNRDEYVKGVIEPYREIATMQKELKCMDTRPTEEQMRRVMEMLAIIFDTKKVSYEEQEKWFADILERTGTYYILNDFKKAKCSLC